MIFLTFTLLAVILHLFVVSNIQDFLNLYKNEGIVLISILLVSTTLYKSRSKYE